MSLDHSMEEDRMAATAVALAMMLGVAAPMDYSYQNGMATYYSYADYGKGPLYAHPSQRYDIGNGLHWCAVNVNAFLDGSVLPGDILLVDFLDYDRALFFEAWDAGPFDGYYIEEHPDLPILIDIPQHLWPLSGRSAEIEMINLSAMERKK